MTTEHALAWKQTTTAMFSSQEYSNSYLFYAHMLAQCKIIFDPTMKAAAGVNFQNDHYNLFINPSGYDLTDGEFAAAKAKDPTVTQHQPGFCEELLAVRLGIIKHEMLHILFAHISRREDRDHKLFNIATDCAINQLINRAHLPNGVIYPDVLPMKPPENLAAEQYYELLYEHAKKILSANGSSANGSSGNCSSGNENASHDKWDESTGDKDLQKDITGRMVKKAGTATTKSRGNLPSSYSDWLTFFNTRPELDWRQVLRNIVGQKRINTRKTLLRQDRRLPNFEWIKGRTKDRQFTLAVISDVSGSVSDSATISLWSEVRNICSIFNTDVTLIQVDTQPSTPEKLTCNTTTIERKACGGTNLHPALTMLKDHNINYDALVITTDGELCASDVEHFAAINKRVIWLIESTGTIMSEMDSGLMKAFKLKG